MCPHQEKKAIFDRLDVTEASCNVGTVRYPEHEYQVDFDRSKNNEPYNESITLKVKVVHTLHLKVFENSTTFGHLT